MKQKFLNSFYALFLFTSIVQAQQTTRVVTNNNDSGDGSLRKTIADAKAGDTITFRVDVGHITLTTGQIEINKSLTISGNGAQKTKIDGNANGNIFYIPTGTVILENMLITNGYTTSGGGIYNSGNLTLTNAVIANNQVAGNTLAKGGGIYNDTNGTLIINGATFTGNKASGGYSASGGAIYNRGKKLSITASRFEDNECIGNGGGICHEATANTVFEMTDFIVKNNRSLSDTQYGGGGLSITKAGGSVTITNGLFEQNTNSALSNYESATITINGTTFDTNFGRDGGAIYSAGTINLTNAAIRNNEARSGGGICSVGNLNITNTAINSNTSNRGSGGGIYQSYGGSLTLNNCDLKDNTANDPDGNARGGGLFMNGGTLSISGGNIVGNTSASNGGGICLAATEATLDKINVAFNTANNDGGGGLYINTINGTSSLIVTNSVFAKNTATGVFANGGGLYLAGGSSKMVNISTSTISGNIVSNGTSISSGYGGGILSGCSLTVNASTIVNNSAPKNGGGTYSANSYFITLKNTIVAQNNASFGADVDGWHNSSGYNLIGQYNGTFPVYTGDLVGTTTAPINPLVDDLGNNGGPTQTHKLSSASPARNAGDPADLLFIDQIGNAVSGGRRDIGAYEYQDPLGNHDVVLKDTQSKVWPNPSNGTIKINLSTALGTTAKGRLIEIGSGKTVSEFAVNGNSEINLQNYAAGLYIVRFESESVTENHKLIIQ